MNPISFTLPIEAEPTQTSGKRIVIRNGKPLFFKNKKASSYENALTVLAANYRPDRPIEGPVRIAINFIMARPGRLMRKKDCAGLIPATTRPDWDNLSKGVLDPLTRLGFWRDDSQIYYAMIQKLYAEKTGSPRIEISIYEYES